MEIIDYIVICASGKGTRLLPLTKHIPKLLVNVNNNCILYNIINYWKHYSYKYVIIIDREYNDIVSFYLNLIKTTCNIEYEILNIECKNGEENSYTINKALVSDKYIDKKILITWCDIFPNSFIPSELFANNNIIFTYKNYGRYDAYNNSIEKKMYGNIIGIYYFAKFNRLIHYEPQMDICDCYKSNFGDFITYEIQLLVDIGDNNKLYEYLNSNDIQYKTRYFNSIIETPENTLIKMSTCQYGDLIIKNEMLFYKYHNNNDTVKEVIPSIKQFNDNSFIMTKINGNMMFNVFNNAKIPSQIILLKQIINTLNIIHSAHTIEIDKEILINDINIEFYSKIFNRIENIGLLLNNFTFIKRVNGIKIKYDHTYIINKLFARISKHYQKNPSYCSIHGDPHMSNILCDSNNNLFFIDPRGYFGTTKIFGLKEYDYSKITYSLSGFDEINRNENHFFIINNDNIDVNITNNMSSIHLNVFEEFNKNILIDMTILHWFGLTDYVKNNIHKCISAYYYGIYLYHLYYEKDKEL